MKTLHQGCVTHLERQGVVQVRCHQWEGCLPGHCIIGHIYQPEPLEEPPLQILKTGLADSERCSLSNIWAPGHLQGRSRNICTLMCSALLLSSMHPHICHLFIIGRGREDNHHPWIIFRKAIFMLISYIKF